MYFPIIYFGSIDFVFFSFFLDLNMLIYDLILHESRGGFLAPVPLTVFPFPASLHMAEGGQNSHLGTKMQVHRPLVSGGKSAMPIDDHARSYPILPDRTLILSRDLVLQWGSHPCRRLFRL